MKSRRKHWSEYVRVTNSKWFRNLPDLEKKCVLLALEEDTHESVAKVRATLTFVFVTAIWAIDFGLWGMAFNFAPIWLAAAGAVLGAVIGFLSGVIITSQKTPQGAKDMQAVAGMTFGQLGAIVGAAGLVGWLIRVLLFR